MSVIVDPKLGINVYAPFQSNQWEDSKKARRWLSFFASRVVMDISCTALPASPAEGDTVLMSSSYPIHASEIARYSTELMAWEYMAPWAGLTVCDTSGNEWYFSGSAWVQNPTAGISALATTVSTHTAQIAALQAGGGSGSGGAGYTYWDPDKPPASPSALDDEFDGSSLASKWTTVNWSSASATDVNTVIPGCLHLQASNLGAKIISALQAIPSGDFSVYAKTAKSISISGASNYGGGLILSDGTTAGSGNQILVFNQTYGTSGTSGVDFATLGTFTGFNVGSSYANDSNSGRYIRIRRQGANYYYGASMDGKTWSDIPFSPSFTPLNFGLVAYVNQSAVADLSFEFFRYFPSATAILGGSRS